MDMTENTLGRTELSENLEEFHLRCYFYYSKSENVKGGRVVSARCQLRCLQALSSVCMSAVLWTLYT